MRLTFRMFVLATLVAGAAACGRPTAERTSSPGATAAEWPLSIEPLAIPAAGNSSEPQISVSSRGPLVSWLEQASGVSTLRFIEGSRDGAWSPAQTVSSGRNWFVSWADVPGVLRLSNGTLVANWYRTTKIEYEAYDLLLSYSRDEGKTWSTPFTPHHDGTQTQHGFASLFEMSTGVGLVWLDAREWELNREAPDGGSVMLRYAAFDPAWKQTADATINLRVCECCQTMVATTSEGVVAAYRDRSDAEIRNIAVTRLTGTAWTEPQVVHDDRWEVDSCPVNGPAISGSGRTLAAAWFTAPGEQGQAFAAFSQDAGRTWSAPIRVDDARSLGHVDIDLLPDGSAAVTWVEFAEQRARFRVRRVEPGGRRSAAVEIAGSASGRVSGYPHMARSGDHLIFAWTESTGAEDGSGSQQVKGAVARLPRTTTR